jgi:ferric-dicitrate binding protein FerR (iron transport regulator)
MKKIYQAIENYLKGLNTPQEQDLLLKFLRDSRENRILFEKKKNEFLEEKNLYSLQEWEAWSKLKSRISEIKRINIQTSPLFTVYKIASIVALILLITGIWGIPVLQKQKVIVNTNPGQTIKMVLPDSSSIILNSSSSLEYHPLSFLMKREINLKGEAYFNIKKQKNTAFRVHTKDFEVKVLGTQFNVNAYEKNKNHNVVLEEGIVNVKLNMGSKKCVQIKSGEKLEIDETEKTFSIKKVNTRLYTSWKEGLLYFYDSKFDDVISRIENRYGAEIKIRDELINSFILSTTIRDEPLEKVLDLFKKVLPVKISEEEGSINISLDQDRYREYTPKIKS